MKAIYKRLLILAAILTIAAFLILRIGSAVGAVNPFLSTLNPIIFDFNATYEKKMEMKYPVFFDYINVVKTVTPVESVILLPKSEFSYSESMWPTTNISICSALLYPRKVFLLQEKYLKNPQENFYVVFTKNFPDFKIKAEKIVLINNKSFSVISGPYDPAHLGANINGLIKL